MEILAAFHGTVEVLSSSLFWISAPLWEWWIFLLNLWLFLLSNLIKIPFLKSKLRTPLPSKKKKMIAARNWMFRISFWPLLPEGFPCCWRWLACWLIKWSRVHSNLSSQYLSERGRRYGRSLPLSKISCLPMGQWPKIAYKLTCLMLEKFTSTQIQQTIKSFFLSDACFSDLWCEQLSMSGEQRKIMSKGKGKFVFPSNILHDQISTTKLKLGSNPTPTMEKTTKYLESQIPIPILRDPQKKTKVKRGASINPRVDTTAMFKKLAAVRENGKKKKEQTLVGFLVGDQKEFPRLFAKLRMEWKPLKGSLIFNILKFGWFELSFSNLEDFNRVWSNRPYHLFSQLLLLKTWYPGFDPSTESISQLDLWVRLHYLPEEFANSDALETIIEGNLIGKFLKMDPTHNSERWNLFTRFCVNTDIEKTLGRSVIVPDEHLHQIRFSLWFDDFSPGCGACGISGHVFKDCPSKNAPFPILQLTIKKPSSKSETMETCGKGEPDADSSQTWNRVGKGNKISKVEQNYFFPSNNVYLSGKGGVNILYESEDSDEYLHHLMEENEQFDITPNLIDVAGTCSLLVDHVIFPTKIAGNMFYNSHFHFTVCPLVCLFWSYLWWLEYKTADLHPYNKVMETKNQKEAVNNKEIRNFSSLLDSTLVEGNWENSKNLAKGIEEKVGLQRPEGSKASLISDSNNKSAELGIGIRKNDENKENPVEAEGQLFGERGALDHFKGSRSGTTVVIEKKIYSTEIEGNSHGSLNPLDQSSINSSEKNSVEEEYLFEDDQFEQEYDDLIIDDMVESDIQPNPSPMYQMEGVNQILISDDPPFSEKDLDDFINNDPTKPESLPMTPEDSYHSMQNSLNASSSFAVEMGKLEVHHVESSTSNSSKRKKLDGIDDTAPSKVKAGKRARK